MFKIRTIKFKDFKELKILCDNFPEINRLEKNKLLSVLQPAIPYNFRMIPSIHLAIEDSTVLGFVILECSSKPNNCWQIQQVFVKDELRKEGIGEELVKYALSVYGGYGVEHFLAEVDSKNFSALTLFHTCGFRRYAKVHYFTKEFDVDSINQEALLEKDFIVRSQIANDLQEIEKLDLSSIPPDLRPALGRSKSYFKGKKNCYILIDKSRNLIIGWFQILKLDSDNYTIELLMSPGWTHLYEQLLNTIISDCIEAENHKIKLTVKVIDYLTELTDILSKLGFLSSEVNELLVRTLWQKVKEKTKQTGKIVIPSTAPIRP